MINYREVAALLTAYFFQRLNSLQYPELDKFGETADTKLRVDRFTVSFTTYSPIDKNKLNASGENDIINYKQLTRLN